MNHIIDIIPTNSEFPYGCSTAFATHLLVQIETSAGLEIDKIISIEDLATWIEWHETYHGYYHRCTNKESQAFDYGVDEQGRQDVKIETVVTLDIEAFIAEIDKAVILEFIELNEKKS
jgi:hypothetical protein